MKKRVIFISELFQPPYDEGMKVTALSLFKAISKYVECIGIGPVSGSSDHNINRIPLNKLMLSFQLRKELQNKKPKLIIYIPEASATLNSFVRYKLLRWISNGAKTIMIALQNREYNMVEKNIIHLLCPERIFVLSSFMAKQLESIGVPTTVLTIGVDKEKFIPASSEKKKALRDKYNIPHDCYLLLHVGHIRENRNIRFLLNLISQPRVKVLIVGSTSTPQEDVLKQELQNLGIFIIDYFISENQELYQLADCYVFPVNGKTGAMEFPLSVLEAMACNLPILTTPFGSLPDNHPISDDFRYFTTAEELKTELRRMRGIIPKTREKAEKFSWENVARQLLEKCKVL